MAKNLFFPMLSWALSLGGIAAALWPLPAIAQSFPPETPNPWYTDTADLIQGQVYLIDALETVLGKSDRQEVTKVRRWLQQQEAQVRFFFGRQYLYPRQLCGPNPGPQSDRLDSAQITAYCTIHRTSQTLEPFIFVLEKREAMLTGAGGDIHVTPSEQTLATLRTLRNNLWALETVVPRLRLDNPQDARDLSVYLARRLRRHYHWPTYESLLRQDHSGLAKILILDRDRPVPNPAEDFPQLPAVFDQDIVPQMPLVVREGQLWLEPPLADGVMIVDVGPMDDTVRSQIQHQIANPSGNPTFKHPEFFKGKGVLPWQEVLAQSQPQGLPLNPNHHYLLRLTQYDLPPQLFTGEAIPRYQRDQAVYLANPLAIDFLVLLTPIEPLSDREYVVLWQILAQFDRPQIRDLENHLNFQ